MRRRTSWRPLKCFFLAKALAQFADGTRDVNKPLAMMSVEAAGRVIG